VLERQIDKLLDGSVVSTVQDESKATYFGGRKPADGLIDWSKSSRDIFNLIRAVTDPYPGAFTSSNGGKLMVWWAEAAEGSGKPGEILEAEPLVVATGDGALKLTRIEWCGEGDAALVTGNVLGS